MLNPLWHSLSQLRKFSCFNSDVPKFLKSKMNESRELNTTDCFCYRNEVTLLNSQLLRIDRGLQPRRSFRLPLSLHISLCLSQSLNLPESLWISRQRRSRLTPVEGSPQESLIFRAALGRTTLLIKPLHLFNTKNQNKKQNSLNSSHSTVLGATNLA